MKSNFPRLQVCTRSWSGKITTELASFYSHDHTPAASRQYRSSLVHLPSAFLDGCYNFSFSLKSIAPPYHPYSDSIRSFKEATGERNVPTRISPRRRNPLAMSLGRLPRWPSRSSSQLPTCALDSSPLQRHQFPLFWIIPISCHFSCLKQTESYLAFFWRSSLHQNCSEGSRIFDASNSFLSSPLSHRLSSLLNYSYQGRHDFFDLCSKHTSSRY